MIKIKPLFLFLALVATVQGPSLAQDEITLTDNDHVIHGEVVSSTPESVTFKQMVGDRADTQTYPVANVCPYSFYTIRRKAVGKDAKAKVELGKFCTEHGFYARARNQFAEAKRIDKTLDLTKEMAAADLGAAKQLLAKAQAAADAGKDRDAFRISTSIIRRFPKTPVADDARKLNDAAHKKIAASRHEMASSREAKHLDRDVAIVERELNRAANENSKALQARTSSKSRQGFEKSIKQYRRALDRMTQLAKKHTGNKVAETEIHSIMTEAQSDLVDVYISLGTIYLTETNYQSALREANSAIGVDPKNTYAKSFRAQVATAASENITGVIFGAGGGAGGITTGVTLGK